MLEREAAPTTIMKCVPTVAEFALAKPLHTKQKRVRLWPLENQENEQQEHKNKQSES
jgi:hypothetical protein